MPPALLTGAMWILARAGGGQNVAPSGGGGGGGSGSGGGTFFLISLLLLGHGAGFGVLLLLLLGYYLFSRMSGGGVTGLFGSGAGSSTAPGPATGYGAPGTPPPPSTMGYAPASAAEASAYGATATPPAAAAGYDDTHPVGVPERFRGSVLPGSNPAAMTGAGMSVAGGVDQIRAHDPGFDDQAFIAGAQTSFFVIQQAWSEVKPELSRSVMADGLAQQFAMQMGEYQRNNRRNMLDGLAVGNATIIAAHSDASFDTVTVRFDAASADYDVDVQSGKVVSGHRDIRPWSEDWVFQRSAKASTTPGAGTMSRKCPNCQAPLNVNAEGACEYCHTAVMSGAYDWVLARIDQVG